MWITNRQTVPIKKYRVMDSCSVWHGPRVGKVPETVRRSIAAKISCWFLLFWLQVIVRVGWCASKSPLTAAWASGLSVASTKAIVRTGNRTSESVPNLRLVALEPPHSAPSLKKERKTSIHIYIYI